MEGLNTGILIFVSCLLILGIIILIIASYTSKNTWKSSDPVKFDYIIFFIVFLWAAVSQFSFVVYLLGIMQKTDDVDESYGTLSTIFYICLTLFVLSYIANIIALTHYLQIWNHALAPGVTRHWLQYWSWFLIMICVLFGNVNIALELCNCLFIPTVDLLAMHLPRSELVNCRINRFWTNSISLDLAFFIMIIVFLATVGIYDAFIIWNTMIICIISFISTLIFAYLRKSYSSKNPIALYRFSFTFKSSEFSAYWIHSHQRIKQSFAELIQLRKPSLVIIDQCSEILGCMKVEGRILKDTKKTWDDSRWRALQNVQRNSEELKKILSVQFGMLEQQVQVENFQFVRMRQEDGELVYDYDTAVKRFVECQMCYSIKNGDDQTS